MAYYTFTKSQVKDMPKAQYSSLGIRKASDGTYYSSKSNSTKYGGVKTNTKPGSSSSSRTPSSSSSSSGSSSTTSRTTSSTPTNGMQDGKYYLNGKEVSVVEYAQAQDFYNPNTPAPTAERMDEIANQDFIDPNVKAAYDSSKPNPINQNYMAEVYNNTLPKTTIPTNAAELGNTQLNYVAPTVDPETGNISYATAGMTGLQEFINASQEFYNQQLERQAAQMEEQKSLLQQFMDSVKSPSEARAEAQGETGINVEDYFASQQAQIKEIESLTNEYNAVKAAKDQQIAQTRDKMASMNFINNQIAQIERNAAPQLNRLSADINAKAAVMQAEQGNFAEAQKYVNQAVQDATADTKFKYDMFSMAYEFNQDAFEKVESIYTNAFNTQMQFAQIAYEEQKAEKEAIGNLLLEYPTAGIDIYNDNLEEAYRKAGTVAPAGSEGGVSLTADMREYNAAVGQGYKGTFAQWLGKEGSDVGSTSVDEILERALFEGATPLQAAQEAVMTQENLGVPIDQKTVDTWTKRANEIKNNPNFQTRTGAFMSSIPDYTNTTSSLTDTIWEEMFSG